MTEQDGVAAETGERIVGWGVKDETVVGWGETVVGWDETVVG